MVRPRVFFDFSLDNEPIGRVILELFTDVAPKTCENFRALCTGERGISPVSQVPLSYKDSIIHRSIAGFMIQGGDFTKRNGSGGESIYGGTFEDESFDIPVESEGLLVMANKGPNTNGSQFFVTLRPCPHLNGKHVTFGRVVVGFDVITKIAEIPTDSKDRPVRPVIVSRCGELELKKKQAPTKVSPNRGRSTSVGSRSHTSSPESRHKRSRSESRSPSRLRSHSRSPGKREPTSKRTDSKKSKNRSKKSRRAESQEDVKAESGKVPREETEEEYDARLEREENERIAAAKRREAEYLRNKLKVATSKTESSGGVRFKGRGAMMYRDPELRRM